jgi:hypothetical protein
MSFAGESLTSGHSTTANYSDGFVLALSADGVGVWSKSFGYSNDPQAEAWGTGIAADATGHVFLTGGFIRTTDLGCGAPLTNPAADQNSVQAFVAKLDATDGMCLWNDVLPFLYSRADITLDHGGDAVVTGYFLGPDSIAFGNSTIAGTAPWNLFIAKLTTDGTPVWGKGFGTSGDNRGQGIAVDAAGSIFVAGYVDGSVDYGGGTLTSTDYAFVIASFDAGGGYRWAKAIDGYPVGLPDGTRVSIAVDPASSHVLLTGWASTTIDLGCGPLTSTGADEAFVAAFMR